jgi:flagellar biosynthetic protein FliR
LAALFKTYEILPISNAGINYKGFPGLAEVAQDFTIAGIKMSAPVMAAVFLVNITMGIIGRAVPQINVLVTSMPVNILVSIGVMIVSLPLFVTGLEEHIFEAMNKSIELIKSY